MQNRYEKNFSFCTFFVISQQVIHMSGSSGLYQFTIKTSDGFIKISTSGDKFFWQLTGYKATSAALQ
jgi:hypothetical protein